MIDKFRKIFGSVIKALEIIYVIEGVKPAARIMVKDDEFDNIKNFLKEYKLDIIKSEFKIKKDDAGDYSDKGSKIGLNEKGYYFSYIAKTKDVAKKLKRLERFDNHVELGMALGYPRCCCEFFERNFLSESQNKNDFTLDTLRESDGYEFPSYNNIAARHFDISLLNHFPCSFNCRESIKIAEKNLGVIKKCSNEWHDIFKGILNSAVLYTENGVFLLREFKLENNKLFFNNIMASTNNELYEKLKKANFIEIIDKNSVLLCGEKIKNVGVMVFN